MGKIKDLVELEGLKGICDVIQVVYLRQLNSLGLADEGLRRAVKPASRVGAGVSTYAPFFGSSYAPAVLGRGLILDSGNDISAS
jgi:hypothetical protein